MWRGSNNRSRKAEGWDQASPHPFNIFIDDITDERKKHVPTIGKMLIPGLLFANSLALGDFTIKGLKKGNGKVVAYCNKWNLKCNLQKSKIMFFKKGGIWVVVGRGKVVNAFSYYP